MKMPAYHITIIPNMNVEQCEHELEIIADSKWVRRTCLLVVVPCLCVSAPWWMCEPLYLSYYLLVGCLAYLCLCTWALVCLYSCILYSALFSICKKREKIILRRFERWTSTDCVQWQRTVYSSASEYIGNRNMFTFTQCTNVYSLQTTHFMRKFNNGVCASNAGLLLW